MGNQNESIVRSRNQLIISALCKHLDLDPKNFQGDIFQSDIKSLCNNILISLQSGTAIENNGEAMKWIELAEKFHVDAEACLRTLNELNGCLASKSVLGGKGLVPSEADIVVFSAIYGFVKGLSDSKRNSLPHLLRWMDYIQNKEDFGETFEQILVEKDKFDPPASKLIVKVEENANARKTAQGKNDANVVERGSSSIKPADAEKLQGDNQAMAEKKISEKVAEEKKLTEKVAESKKKLPEKVADDKDKDISVSLLKIQVGLIRKASKHPSADSLLIEEIDTGDPKLRQVVSGLAKYCNPDDLMNRRVVLITNVKPGKLRDVISEGLVLCASNEDHTVVEPLAPPEGAKVGECISFSGHEGNPEAVLNPKKKQLEKITPHLFTDDNGIAMFKGIPFITSGGPCTSSIPNASIR